MSNKPVCPLCGVKRPVRMLLFAILIVGIGALLFFSGQKSGQDVQSDSEPLETGVVNGVDSGTGQPFLLAASELAQAELIPVNIQSVNLSVSDRSENTRLISLVPQAEWQGDFSAARIAATLLNRAGEHLHATDVLIVYLLPCELKTVGIYPEAALGCLSIDKSGKSENLLQVQTRGCLPQELEFMAKWDELSPKFTADDGVLNRAQLTEAVIEELGPSAAGMSFPFMSMKKVDNIKEIFASVQISHN
ncbi:MAG: hypothetical protein IJD04_06480 [Desulfovibrionaceae bacterium]|nr:hypothetical protein [Desulfovibrionaceae bacterium]